MKNLLLLLLTLSLAACSGAERTGSGDDDDSSADDDDTVGDDDDTVGDDDDTVGDDDDTVGDDDDTVGDDDDSSSGSGQILINELMAGNDDTVADENGDFDDWLELYNPGSVAVDISGWLLGDDVFTDFDPWTFPKGTTIEPGGFLVVWCDDEGDQGPLHADFKLSGDGEPVGLYDADENPIDVLEYPALEDGEVYARTVDGGSTWEVTTDASPGASNE